MSNSAGTVIEALGRALESAARFNPNEVERPHAIVWADSESQWLPLIPQLRRLLPQLLTLGEYAPEARTGPAIWLRCVTDGAHTLAAMPQGVPPVVYLPGVSRQALRAGQDCPEHLQPLVELQYRGVCWTQRNGRDWTVEAFLSAADGGLSLDVARDATTRRALFGALTELALTPLDRLRGKRLEAEDFDRLFSDDRSKDLLLWANDPAQLKAEWNAGRYAAFKARCNAEFGFDPDTDGVLVAAERLGRRDGVWASVWERFSESPALYPGLVERLREAKPDDLFAEPSSWPQVNDDAEMEVGKTLLALAGKSADVARRGVLALEEAHAARREWVWSKLGQAPLAQALASLALVAERTASDLGGASIDDQVKAYADGAWQVDAAALAAMAAVRTASASEAVSIALGSMYGHWLDTAARHLQALAAKQPLPGRERQQMDELTVAAGGVAVFADGLRFDVAQRLLARLRARGRAAGLTTRWAGLPTVTATAKPAVSPVARAITGLTLGEDFLPVLSDTAQSLSVERFRKLLAAHDYQYLADDQTGDPQGRAWTEFGDLDKLGHALQDQLAARIDEQIELLVERIEELLEAGWNEILVVTDHGWLWLPSGLPKVDLPKYLTASRWARCAAVKGAAQVAVPLVPWHWNPQEHVAVAPGIACFGAGNAYAHGGVSLQECLIPIIRVSPGAERPKRAKLNAVDWVGLRCRLQVESTQSGLTVDLRARANDPGSSISEPKRLDASGRASLLVADDGLAGAPVVVVVLDAAGELLTKRPTIVGGED